MRMQAVASLKRSPAGQPSRRTTTDDRPYRADPLGKDAGRSRAGDAETGNRPPAHNEDSIQRNVDHVDGQRDPERRLHVLQPTQHAERSQKRDHGRRAKETHLHVLGRTVLYFTACAQPPADGIGAGPADQHEEQTKGGAEQKGKAGHARGSALPLRAQRLRHLRLGTDAQEVEDPEDARQRGRAHAQRRQRLGPQACHKRGIDQAGQRFGDQGDQNGQGEGENRAIGRTQEGVRLRRRDNRWHGR